jgi:hypothetical protein
MSNLDFTRKWPDYCTTCGGWGQLCTTEMHGFTHGPGEQVCEPCEGMEPGQCHRCAAKDALSPDGDGPCTECGWNFDDGLIKGGRYERDID